MAIYHLSVKTVSRSAGRSATAAAAYRSGSRIECEREGRTHDYTRKQGVAHCEIIAPDAATWAKDRSALWNAAEAAEKRKNSTVAREYEIALPHELSRADQIDLAREFGRWIADRYGVGVDVSVHEPVNKGESRENVHAHVLTTTRRLTQDGLGEKTRVLDDKQTGSAEVVAIRAKWAEMQNERLREHKIPAHVDSRTIEKQREDFDARVKRLEAAGEPERAFYLRGFEDYYRRLPEPHMGPQVAAMEQKAKDSATREGRQYRPVTEVGRQVHEARENRRNFGRSAQALQGARTRVDDLARQLKERVLRSLQSFGEKLARRNEHERREREIARQRALDARLRQETAAKEVLSAAERLQEQERLVRESASHEPEVKQDPEIEMDWDNGPSL